MSEPIKVTINGKEIETEKGAVLIDVCRDNENSIPSFCYYKDLEVQASCRMCLVRIDKIAEAADVLHDQLHRRHGRYNDESRDRKGTALDGRVLCSPTIRSIARFAIAAANASCRKSFSIGATLKSVLRNPKTGSPRNIFRRSWQTIRSDASCANAAPAFVRSGWAKTRSKQAIAAQIQ
jgi:hypothetical protein